MQVSSSTGVSLDAPPERTVGARLRDLGDRFVGVSDTLAVLRKLELEAARTREIDALAFVAGDVLHRLERLPPESSEFRIFLQRAEATLVEIERMLLALEERVPQGAFRKLLDSSGVSPVAMIHYARLLSLHFEAKPRQSERIEYLVHRLLTLSRPDGQLVIRPRADVDPALWYIVGQSRAEGSVRAAGVAFFRSAIKRLEELQSVADVFESGFYLDVRGYKISMREALIDPDILYASSELTAAIGNRLVELRALEGIDQAAIEERMASVEAKVNEIFRSLEPEEPESIAQRFELRKPREDAATKIAEVAKKPSQFPRILLAFLFVVLTGISVGSIRKTTRNENEFIPYQPKDLAALSPILESGWFSRGIAETIFIGNVAPSTWLGMTKAERRKAAQDLSVSLRKKNVLTGIVYLEKRVALEITRGKVLFVQ